MKVKTARRRLTRLAGKFARQRRYGIIRSTSGLGKQWKLYTRVLMGGGA